MNRLRVVVVTVGLACAGVLHAQGVEWGLPLYADVVRADLGGAHVQAPIHPYWVSNDLPQNVMQLSLAGTPGVVIAGGADIGEEDGVWTPVTPYAAKIATSDGHLLWSWQPQPDDPVEGRIWSTAAGASGAILVAGSLHWVDGELSRFMLTKLDGATGTVLWQLTGPEGTAGFDVVVDAAGDVLLTSSEADYGGQRITKYAGIDGSPLWSTLIPNGRTDCDDFRIALDAQGNVLAGGFYVDTSDPSHQLWGAQVAKLRGTDGTEVWRYRNVDTAILVALQAIAPAPNGDVIMQGGYVGHARLAAADGSVIWQRDEDAGYSSYDMLVDPSGRMFAAGTNSSTEIAWLRRYNPDDGTVAWQADIPVAGVSSLASVLALGIDGKLMVGWEVGWGPLLMGAAVVETESPMIDWTARFGFADTNYDTGRTVGIVQAPDGSIFVGSYAHTLDTSPTWTVHKLTSALTDAMFANGFD